MRKITQESCNALMNHSNYANSNTQVMNGYDGTIMLLHGHVIAIHGNDGKLQVTLAGWPTVTTRERLSSIPGVSVSQKAGEQYLNGKLWDGGLIEVA